MMRCIPILSLLLDKDDNKYDDYSPNNSTTIVTYLFPYCEVEEDAESGSTVRERYSSALLSQHQNQNNYHHHKYYHYIHHYHSTSSSSSSLSTSSSSSSSSTTSTSTFPTSLLPLTPYLP